MPENMGGGRYSVGDFIYDHFSWVIAAAITIIGIAHLGRLDAEKRERFMTQCKQDRKEYECVAMWRAGESHMSVVPVVVHTR